MVLWLNILSFVSAGSIEAKLHAEPSWMWETKVDTNRHVHMTVIATVSIYGKQHTQGIFV